MLNLTPSITKPNKVSHNTNSDALATLCKNSTFVRRFVSMAQKHYAQNTDSKRAVYLALNVTKRCILPPRDILFRLQSERGCVIPKRNSRTRLIRSAIITQF